MMDNKKNFFITTILYAIMMAWSVFILIPICVMVLAAFKTKKEIFLEPLGLPDSLAVDNFQRAWDTGMGKFMVNSMLVTGLSVVLIVIASAMAGYALARTNNRLTQILYLLLVACFAIPVQAVLIPLYQMISAAGLLNSKVGIVLPYAAYGIPFTTILLYAFFVDFPKELEESARLDGLGQVGIFFRIVLPLSGAVIASAAIFQAVFVWNEFLLALLMLTKNSLKTMPVGLMVLAGQWSSDWPAIMAGLTIAVVPLLVIFVAAQKYFVCSLAGIGNI